MVKALECRTVEGFFNSIIFWKWLAPSSMSVSKDFSMHGAEIPFQKERNYHSDVCLLFLLSI